MLNKKAAMFGKLSQLDHSYFNRAKTAAMFGLDARIALAIFGALSVITGAALFSAINKARMESYRQYFVEHVKASEQYYLDNGKQLPQNISTISYGPDLVVNRENLSTWQGPYISYNESYTTTIIDSTTAKIGSAVVFQVWLAPGSTWASSTAANECDSVGDLDCCEYMSIYGGDADGEAAILKIFNELDSFVDGGDGKVDGKVRFNSVNFGALMYKGMNRPRSI